LNRRRALTALALAAGTTFLAGGARGQAGKVRRVGFLSGAPTQLFYSAFRSGMTDLGYVEGKNVLFHARFAQGGEDLDALAVALVGERPDLLIGSGGPAVRALRNATPDAPLVYSFSGDPVAAGFAKSLGQPGNHMSGITLMSLDLVGKRMELLKEALPTLRSVAILANPDHPGEQLERQAALASAATLKLEPRYFQAQTPADLMAALEQIAKTGAEGLVVFPDALTITNRQQIAENALKARKATVSGWAEFAESGFLLSYGPHLNESYRRLATFADKVLKGTDPGNLPIERPTVMEMVVNARTAQALRIEVPRAVLVRADRVLS